MSDNFDDVQISIEDINKRAAEIENRGKSTEKESDVYYPGQGISSVRLLPFYSESRQVWDFNSAVTTHDDFIKGERIVCVRQTYGEKCAICDLWFEYGKKFGYRDGRFKKFVETYHFNNNGKFRDRFNIIVLEDCGDKGSKDFERGPYAPGSVLTAQVGIELSKSLIRTMADPDWSGSYHPQRGRNMKITGTIGSNGYREYSLTFSPTQTAIAPDSAKIKEILAKSKDLSSYRVRPTPEKQLAITARIQEIRALIEGAISGPPPISVPGSGTDAVGGPKEPPPVASIPAVAAPTQTATPVPPPPTPVAPPVTPAADSPAEKVALPMVPTAQRDSSGNPLCFKQGVYDSNNMECQICDKEFACSAAPSKLLVLSGGHPIGWPLLLGESWLKNSKTRNGTPSAYLLSLIQISGSLLDLLH